MLSKEVAWAQRRPHVSSGQPMLKRKKCWWGNILLVQETWVVESGHRGLTRKSPFPKVQKFFRKWMWPYPHSQKEKRRFWSSQSSEKIFCYKLEKSAPRVEILMCFRQSSPLSLMIFHFQLFSFPLIKLCKCILWKHRVFMQLNTPSSNQSYQNHHIHCVSSRKS